MKTIALAISIMIATLGQSLAQPVESANDIKASCQFVGGSAKTDLDAANALFCMGFVRAILFTGRRLDGQDKFCPPEGVHVSQATKTFLAYLNENPEKGQLPPEDLMILAFRKAWHCQ